ncbi:hypothetical protein, partial [Salmonella enterica]|uniref:hypothetical protein n=1 Tax=Salmonella enterica TaxID=28901 RepID=UPI0019D5D241
PPPLSEPSLARRAPAELVAHTDEPPPSIRCGAQASRPPSHPPAADAEADVAGSGAQLIFAKVPTDATGS